MKLKKVKKVTLYLYEDLLEKVGEKCEEMGIELVDFVVVAMAGHLARLSDPILTKMLKQGGVFKITTKYEVEKSGK